MLGAVFQFFLRPNEVHSSGGKLVYNYNQSSVPERKYLFTSFSHLNWSKDEWGNHQHGNLITNGVGERDLGVVMVFHHPNQAKMEAFDSLSALHQCD